MNGQVRIFSVVAILICSGVAVGDSIQLKNGHVMQGKWLNADDKSASEWIVELDDGTKVNFPRNDVKGIVRQATAADDYASKLAKVDDAAETHRKIVEWCLNQKLNGLAAAHRERIVELDPEDKVAWAAMGYLKTSEGWKPKEQVQRQRGLVQKGSKWYLPHDLAIMEAGDAAKVRRAEAEKKVVKAFADLKTATPKADEARRYLAELRDPLAVSKLREMLVKDRSKPNPASRRDLIEIIARIPSGESVATLVDSCLEDPDDSIRIECIEILEKFGREPAVQMLMGRLVNANPAKDNPITYDRAGQALAVLGDDRCIARLLDCLVTKHLIEAPQGNAYNVGQTSDGNAGMSQGKKKPIEKLSQNNGVLAALVELSHGENFSFDVNRWREWYAAKYAGPNAYVVRDP